MSLDSVTEVAVFSKRKDAGAVVLGAVGAVNTTLTTMLIIELRNARGLGLAAILFVASFTASIAIPSFMGAHQLLNGNPRKVNRKDKILVERIDWSTYPKGWRKKYRTNR